MFEQERFIGRLQRHVQADPAVRVCFLYGSFGRRANDAYSDVDIALVYADAAEREKAWAERREFVKAAMPYVAVRSFDAAHVRPYLHVALYSNGTKADFSFETMDDLSPTPKDRELRILKDSGGWGERHQAASSRLAPAQPYISPADLTDLDNRFWVMLWDALRLLRRGRRQAIRHLYAASLLHVAAAAGGAAPRRSGPAGIGAGHVQPRRRGDGARLGRVAGALPGGARGSHPATEPHVSDPYGLRVGDSPAGGAASELRIGKGVT